MDAELVGEYTKALALDPNLLPALKGRANAYFHLKQFKRVILDYDKVISLDPQDYVALNGRGIAKMRLGNDYDAISDIGAAIAIRERASSAYFSYETRADAYLKTRQWDLAIRDFTTAISLQVGGSVLLMNVDQFRALYPEYKSASNEAIARKLQQTFFPDLKYEDFAKDFFSRRAMPSTVIPELYLKRSDAYLKMGNWHRAVIEFSRAINGFSGYADAVDRWREIDRTSDTQRYIDMKTFDDARKGSVKLWVKEARGSNESVGPYSLVRLELNCGTRRIRTVSSANYDASGNLTGSREGGTWQTIVPETLGETLYSGTCDASQKAPPPLTVPAPQKVPIEPKKVPTIKFRTDNGLITETTPTSSR